MKEFIIADWYKCSRDLFEIHAENFLEKYVKLTELQLFKKCYPLSRALRNVRYALRELFISHYTDLPCAFKTIN